MEQRKPWQDKGGGDKNRNPENDSNKPFVAKWKEEGKEEKSIPFNKDWIITNIDMDTVYYADCFGKQLVNEKLTTSQLRNFFGEVRRIQIQKELNTTDLFLLKPKLAYASKKAKGNGVKILKSVLDIAHEAVVQNPDINEIKARFDRFVSFLEAILAYHKGYGGRDTSR